MRREKKRERKGKKKIPKMGVAGVQCYIINNIEFNTIKVLTGTRARRVNCINTTTIYGSRPQFFVRPNLPPSLLPTSAYTLSPAPFAPGFCTLLLLAIILLSVSSPSSIALAFLLMSTHTPSSESTNNPNRQMGNNRRGTPKQKGALRAKSGCYTCRIRRKVYSMIN